MFSDDESFLYNIPENNKMLRNREGTSKTSKILHSIFHMTFEKFFSQINYIQIEYIFIFLNLKFIKHA